MVAGYFQAPSLGEPLIPMLMGANTGYHQELQAILVSTKISLGPITSLFSPSPSGSRDRTQAVRLDNILLVLELIQGRDKLRTKSLVVFQRKDKTRMSNLCLVFVIRSGSLTSTGGSLGHFQERARGIQGAGSASPQTRADN